MYHCMIVHSTYPYEETRVQRQAEALIQRGHHVDVICLRKPGDAAVDQVDGARVFRIPVQRDKRRGALGQFLEYLTFAFLAFVKLTRLHLGRHYDVVQVHNLPDFLVFAGLIPRLTGSRIILDLHDLMPEFYCAKFNSGMSSLPVRLIALEERASCYFAHQIITVTESWRETLVQRGVPPDKVSVVMNLADTRYFSAAPSTAGSADPLRLVYHGQVTRRYGVDLLLQALARVKQDVPNVHLTIHGGGDFLATISSLVTSLRLEDAVTIHREFLPVSELGNFVSSHHVGIVPYRRDVFTDGILPTKLLEYVALGLPVIAACTPAIQAYFDENMVEFFEPENVDDLAQRILYLSKHPERRRELARNSGRFNDKFNWTSQRERYVDLAEELGIGKLSRQSNVTVR